MFYHILAYIYQSNEFHWDIYIHEYTILWSYSPPIVLSYALPSSPYSLNIPSSPPFTFRSFYCSMESTVRSWMLPMHFLRLYNVPSHQCADPSIGGSWPGNSWKLPWLTQCIARTQATAQYCSERILSKLPASESPGIQNPWAWALIFRKVPPFHSGYFPRLSRNATMSPDYIFPF